jgi:rhamnogalacturonyl hydrolase YesR
MTITTEMRPILEESIQKVEKWVEDSNYKGYDPADGLTTCLRPLTLGNLFLDRVLLQLVQRTPINLRPLFAIKPLDSFIGRGYMVRGYLTMLKLTGNDIYKDKAIGCLDWLKKNRAPEYDKYCWGKLFDFASRGGFYKALEPISIWTALIGLAFLEAYEMLHEGSYLEVGDSICAWIIKLPRYQAENGFCIGYHNHDYKGTIHNSNMVGAAFLAQTAKHTGNQEYLEVAEKAMAYSCSRQLPNGAWLYGEELNHGWIDNFHTGYNLDALKRYIEITNDKTYEQNLIKGFSFFRNNFFEESGRPKYYHDRTYPIDSQCAAQAIESLANFADYDDSSLELGFKVAKWTIENMQDRAGYFYFRQYPYATLKVPMIHWAQATTYQALTLLLSKLSGPMSKH